jgi:DNA-binding MarR family transcriptional regulator
MRRRRCAAASPTWHAVCGDCAPITASAAPSWRFWDGCFAGGTPMTATDLARLERLQPQSLTRIIAELDEQGLIRRTPDAADGRQLLIEITQAGKDLLVVDAYRQNQWLMEAMAAKMTRAEREILAIAADLLDKLAGEPTEPDQTSRSDRTA